MAGAPSVAARTLHSPAIASGFHGFWEDELPFGDSDDGDSIASPSFNPSPVAAGSTLQEVSLTGIDNVLSRLTPHDELATQVAQSVLWLKPHHSNDVPALADALAQLHTTHRVYVRETVGSDSKALCVTRLRHKSILLRPPSNALAPHGACPLDMADNTLIVEAAFKETFRIGSPSPRYQAIFDRLPDVFVAPAVQFTAAVDCLASEIAASFKGQSLNLPPWRTRQALGSLWDPSLALDTPINTPTCAPVGPQELETLVPLRPHALPATTMAAPVRPYIIPSPPKPTPQQRRLPALDPPTPPPPEDSSLTLSPPNPSTPTQILPPQSLPIQIPSRARCRAPVAIMPLAPPLASPEDRLAQPPLPPRTPTPTPSKPPPQPRASHPAAPAPLHPWAPPPAPPSPAHTQSAHLLQPATCSATPSHQPHATPLEPPSPPPTLARTTARPVAASTHLDTAAADVGTIAAAARRTVATAASTTTTTTTTTSTTTKLIKRGSRTVRTVTTTTSTTSTTAREPPSLTATVVAAVAGAVVGVLATGGLPVPHGQAPGPTTCSDSSALFSLQCASAAAGSTPAVAAATTAAANSSTAASSMTAVAVGGTQAAARAGQAGSGTAGPPRRPALLPLCALDRVPEKGPAMKPLAAAAAAPAAPPNARPAEMHPGTATAVVTAARHRPSLLAMVASSGALAHQAAGGKLGGKAPEWRAALSMAVAQQQPPSTTASGAGSAGPRLVPSACPGVGSKWQGGPFRPQGL